MAGMSQKVAPMFCLEKSRAWSDEGCVSGATVVTGLMSVRLALFGVAVWVAR